MNKVTRLTFLIICILLSACTSTQGSIAERQQAVQEMKTEVLTELYEVKPDVEGQVSQALGYAVFSNANINLIFASFGGGYGVLRNNLTGQDTYMKMGEVGLGFGAGIKDFRVVMVFHTQDALDRFMENGIAFGAQADAAAVADDQGVAFGGEVTVDNITIYQMTKSGLALQATVKGIRFWEDEELN
ncbi:YSC84-related protein [Gammaproteobacteria bacterium]|nr:YSC84-related protein [Gammaproteobacteria bacterium]